MRMLYQVSAVPGLYLLKIIELNGKSSKIDNKVDNFRELCIVTGALDFFLYIRTEYHMSID